MRAPTADTGAGGTQAQAQAQAQTQTQMLFEAQPPLLTDGDTVRELDSIRTKLALLVESLNDILMLHPATPWPPVLEQLNSIIARFESVQRELMAQSVPLALVHPHMLIPQDPDFIPRILLRTKLIPEIEDAERAAIAAYFGPAALGPASGTSAAGVPVVSAVPHADAPGPAANPVAAAFEGLFDVDPLNQAQTLKQQQEWENKVDQYEELLQAALDIFSDLRQELQETVLRPRQRAGHAATSSGLAPPSLSVSGSGALGSSLVSSGAGSPAGGQLSLEKTLAWMSSGPR